MTEAKPIPAVAMTAFKLATDRHNVLINEIATETLDAMGLSTSEGWKLALDTLQAVREVPDGPALVEDQAG